MIKRLLILVVIIVGLFVAVDFGLRQVAENRLASRVGDSLELEQDPDPSLNGWPFILHAIDGNFPSVGVSADELTSRGVTIEDLEVSLHNVRFELSDVISGEDRSVRFGGGDGSAAITGEALTEAAQQAGADVTVSFADGEVVVSSESFGEAAGTPSIEGRTLSISAEGLPQPVSITLPSLGGRASYESIDVQDDRLIVRVTLSAGELSVD